MSIGERIKTARQAVRLTQGQLAAKVGATSGMTISRWETDRFGPGREWLEPLAKALNVTTDWLVTGAEAKLEEPPTRVESDALTSDELALLTSMLGTPPTYEELRWVLAAPHHRLDVKAMFMAIEGARRGMTPEQVTAMEAETARFAKK